MEVILPEKTILWMKDFLLKLFCVFAVCYLSFSLLL
nr:MAG TPA: hypothetical protein [Caudoviricetes sp.]